jgi:hypothetical protein
MTTAKTQQSTKTRFRVADNDNNNEKLMTTAKQHQQ